MRDSFKARIHTTSWINNETFNMSYITTEIKSKTSTIALVTLPIKVLASQL
jgi:hypothetical protein